MNKKTEDRIVRHRGFDRAFHWAMAASVLVLLGTGFFPVLGVRFDWVTPHWIAGVAMIALILVHIVRVAARRTLFSMGLDKSDLGQIASALRFSRRAAPKHGKYSLAQKGMHHLVMTASLVAAVTGGMLLVKIDTPFWRRNSYWLDASGWGWTYVAHGFAGLAFVSLIVLHIYFAVRPEKRYFLRAMVRGWLSRAEYDSHYDPTLWSPEEIGTDITKEKPE